MQENRFEFARKGTIVKSMAVVLEIGEKIDEKQE